MHPSIIEKSDRLKCTTVSPSVFVCPLCPKFTTKSDSVIQRHLLNHEANAVHFKDKIICRCNLPCRDGGHFHCPFCGTTIIRKDAITTHVMECKNKWDMAKLTWVPPSQPPSPETHPPVLSSMSVEHSFSLPPSVSAVKMDHSYTQTASPKTPAVATVFGKEQKAPAEPEEPDLSQSPPATTSEDPIAPEEEVTEDVPPTHMKCPHCPVVLYKRNLFLHIERKHGQAKDVTAKSHLQSTSVDQSNGLYAVRKTCRGFSVPVHVQRKTWGQQHVTRCEMEDCQQYHLLAQRSGLSHSLCHHIRSLDYCDTTASEEQLDHQVLQEMVENRFFAESKVTVCKTRQQEAEEAHVPLSVLVDLTGSKNHICLSIHEPKLHHYSTLGRVIVTHNIKKNTWHCPCAKARASCTHKYIAKWHLFQTHKHLFKTVPPTSTSATTTHSVSHPTAEMERSVRYVYKYKKIPTTLPEEVTARRAPTDFPQQLFPNETTCKLCEDEPKLEEAVQITNKATVVGMEGVIQKISTYSRRCTKCKMVYRYQEWKDGLHNFNDRVIITLQLCLYLRHNLQNHVSVSRVISSLESLLKVKFPASDLIFHGYCHFEALCDTEYKYSCVNCGFYPPVVVMDLHRKGVFSFEVSELEQPREDYNGEHDITAFWDSVDLHMISRGFFESPAQNPFVVKPKYDNWAPWIGGETRKGNTVLNTEFEKVPLQRSSSNPQLGDLTEDRLVDELLKQKVSTIRKLCKSCNMDTKGSRMDLLNRLREEMKSRKAYDKVFQSIWGASGGWSVIMCPHGIVYSVKFNLRAESPRDFADLLLSWKHFPNVCVYDFARGLVAHANLRVPDNPPFQPFEGRLAEPTNDNVEAAGHGNLEVHLPWLVDKLANPEPNGHPVTGCREHYALYDKFHQANTKDPQDVLRRIQIVPELQATLNSQVAEQLFASLRKNNYFLNNMGPSAHIFLMRNILEHKNNRQNEKLLKRQLRRGLQLQQLHSVTLSDLGQVILGQQTLPDTDGGVSAEPQQTDGVTLDAENTLIEEETLISGEAPPKASNEGLCCGPHCASLTNLDLVEAQRSSWSISLHQDQEKVLNYVLDPNRPGNELIVRTFKTCLTRSDFLTLGLQQEMESTIGNACFEMVEKIVLSKGKNVYIADLYVCPTWLPPHSNDPMASLPSQAHQKDAILIPLWTPGHYQICVIKPAQKEILFLDSLFAKSVSGFRGQQYMPILRNIAQKICAGQWTEKTGKDLKGFPTQDFGSDCGIFMLMSALYVALDAQFDYTILDMPVLRRWWCLLLLENNTLNSYGKVFAHWTKECQELLEGKHAPVFTLKRKAEQDTEETMAEQASDDNRQCMADPERFCVFQISQNTGQRLLYPDAESLEWLQCQECKGWLHKECAGKYISDDSFNCGCTDINEQPSIMEAVEKGGILAVFSKTQIKSLHDDLINGSIRSNRMYLWQNPSTSINLKQHLKLRALSFSDQRIFELLRVIEEVTGIGEKIKRGEIRLLDFVFDVMLPEILIKILQEGGMTRLKAEFMLASGSLF